MFNEKTEGEKMNVLKRSGFFKRVFFGIFCLVLVTTTVTPFGSNETAKAAAISPLITSYKPQVVNTDVNVSYTDSSGNTVTGTIYHPGIMTKTELDNMRDHVRAGDEPWSSAFNSYASDSRSNRSPRIYYEVDNDIFVNIRGPWAYGGYSNPSQYVGDRANKDGATALKQAIMWYITGDDTYRSNAMYVIRSYSAIQSVATHTNFRFGTLTYLLSSAAEILRYSDCQTESLKWTNTDTTNFTNMMQLLAVTYNPHTFFMNQHSFSVMGTMGKAIFTNDLQLYAEAVEAATVNSSGDAGGRNGSIKQQLRMMTTNEKTGAALAPSDNHVQAIEMGRDVGHSYGDIGGLTTLAQTISAQGTKVDPVTGTISTASNAVNAFNFLGDRLLEGTTYILKYHLGYDVLWTPARSDGASYYETINQDNRGRIDPFLGILYNYYRYTENRDMTQEKYKYLAYAYETRMPEGASDDFPASGTLLFTPNAAMSVGLSNQKLFTNDTTYVKQAEHFSALLTGTASVNTEAAVTYVRTNASGTGTQFAVRHYTIPNKGTLGIRVRTNGAATINLIQLNRSNSPLATYAIPNTNNEWYTLGYDISSATLLSGSLLYFSVSGSASQVDIDYLDFNPSASSITPVSSIPAIVSLQSYNFPTNYLRHTGFKARIDPNVSPVQDRQFKMVAGLADATGVSFESANFPGRFLRVRSNGEVWVDLNDNTFAFNNDATFRRVSGLADATKSSFQMWADSTRYLRHSNFVIYAQSGSGSMFEGDATFTVLDN